jgi:hypothetical protein
MMNYIKLGYAPEIEDRKARAYAEWLAKKGEKVEAVAPIQWQDGEQGFEISILQNQNGGNMLNVTTVTIEQINERLPLALAEAAELYDLPYSTLAEWAREGKIKARQSGKTWITTPEAVERFKRCDPQP